MKSICMLCLGVSVYILSCIRVILGQKYGTEVRIWSFTNLVNFNFIVNLVRYCGRLEITAMIFPAPPIEVKFVFPPRVSGLDLCFALTHKMQQMCFLG